MSNLEKAKQIIEQNLQDARFGIFNRHNCGDYTVSLYSDSSLMVLICYAWQYFMVFGLSDAEFRELEDYYHKLNND